MKRRITIEFEWYSDREIELDADDLKYLENQARNKIKKEWAADCTGGDLQIKIADLDFYGNWGIVTTENIDNSSII